MNERNGEINTVSLMNKKTFMCAFKATLPVFAGYMVLGMGFGILMHSKGYAWYWSVLMSIIVFAGSMQYVAVDLFSSGASLITYAIMTLVVNARHIFYGLTMLVKYKDVKKAKPYLIFALTDETFSLVCDVDLEKDIDKDNYYFLVSILNQSYWVIGSLLGGILGAVISFNSTGIEFSMTALFAITVLEQWEKNKDHIPAITGFVVSTLCLIIFGASDFLIPAMIIITVVLLFRRKFKKEVLTDE